MKGSGVRLDVLGLLLAGFANTLLAPADIGLVLAPGTALFGGDLPARSAWIGAHAARWQIGWSLWYLVTLTFAWSFYALARHLDGPRPWVHLAVGAALLAAAVDLVGIAVQTAVLPGQGLLFQALDPALRQVGAMSYTGLEQLANTLTYVLGYGLYTLAGLLLLPALFATPAYYRWLAWLGLAEWLISSMALVLLALQVPAAVVPLVISFILYAPWVWGSAWWIHRLPVL